MIVLKEITNKNVWDVCRLKVRKDQESFVALNIESLAEAYATRNAGFHALPLAVYDEEVLIGFVMIGKGTVGEEGESETIKKNYCLWRFMIDARYQGKGYASKILDEVIRLVKTFPYGPAEYIWLSYEPENLHGREVYHKYGFRENGEMCDGEIMALYRISEDGSLV